MRTGPGGRRSSADQLGVPRGKPGAGLRRDGVGTLRTEHPVSLVFLSDLYF